jgi:hypothetical protein
MGRALPRLLGTETRISRFARNGRGNAHPPFLTGPASFLILILCLSGCAAPGEPVPPRPIVPEAVTDLAARQLGDAVVLTFTLPKNSIERHPLAEKPAIEIFRALEGPGRETSPQNAPRALVYTVPPALVDTYFVAGQVQFADPLKPQAMAAYAGGQAVYTVRTRASKKKDSEDSNVAAVRIYPVAEKIADLAAQVTKEAVVLTWTPPEKATSGTPLEAPAGYRVYRALVEPGAEAEAAANQGKPKLAGPLALVGVTPAPPYRDTQFEFGRIYAYTVRSVAQYETGSVESADSRLAVVAPRNSFPPAAPQGLAIIIVPATPQEPAHLELSWAISPQADVAGYNIYRSEEAGAPGVRLNRELLLTPVFRDIPGMPGRTYFYRVTAVDRAGNESAPSAPVSSAVPAEAGPKRP